VTDSNVLTFKQEPVKKTVNERLMERLGERDEVIKALINNENINRKRLDDAEVASAHIAGILSRPFIGRLRWLFLGR